MAKTLKAAKSTEILVLRALADQTRQKIVKALEENGELSFEQLKQIVGLNPSTLSHHLKILMEAGLVANYYKKVEASREYSFYELSWLGKNVLPNIRTLLEQGTPG